MFSGGGVKRHQAPTISRTTGEADPDGPLAPSGPYPRDRFVLTLVSVLYRPLQQ